MRYETCLTGTYHEPDHWIIIQSNQSLQLTTRVDAHIHDSPSNVRYPSASVSTSLLKRPHVARCWDQQSATKCGIVLQFQLVSI